MVATHLLHVRAPPEFDFVVRILNEEQPRRIHKLSFLELLRRLPGNMRSHVSPAVQVKEGEGEDRCVRVDVRVESVAEQFDLAVVGAQADEIDQLVHSGSWLQLDCCDAVELVGFGQDLQ